MCLHSFSWNTLLFWANKSSNDVFAWRTLAQSILILIFCSQSPSNDGGACQKRNYLPEAVGEQHTYSETFITSLYWQESLMSPFNTRVRCCESHRRCFPLTHSSTSMGRFTFACTMYGVNFDSSGSVAGSSFNSKWWLHPFLHLQAVLFVIWTCWGALHNDSRLLVGLTLLFPASERFDMIHCRI